MKLNVTHMTTYRYSDPVSLCHNEIRLMPRQTPRQRLISFDMDVSPEPESIGTIIDYFGNTAQLFSIQAEHDTLTILARSVVDTQVAELPGLLQDTPWEVARDAVAAAAGPDTLDAYQHVFDSPLIRVSPAYAAYAAPSFPAGRSYAEALLDLNHRIFTEFEYDQTATTVATPVDEVLRDRKGVCQDFAHVMIACLRAMGLPARYISGYLESNPQNIGAEASHAWVSAFIPNYGWMDLDPTNDAAPANKHVTIAWGRDYSDVSPIKGVILGGGNHLITVEVSVVPAPAP